VRFFESWQPPQGRGQVFEVFATERIAGIFLDLDQLASAIEGLFNGPERDDFRGEVPVLLFHSSNRRRDVGFEARRFRIGARPLDDDGSC
jgi:hypothetical protein